MSAVSRVDPAMLAAATGPDGVARLLAHLGYEADPLTVPREAYGALGLDPAEPEPRGLHRVARHGGLEVWLLELGDVRDRVAARRLALRLYRHNRGVRRLYVFAGRGYDRLALAAPVPGAEPPALRWATLRPADPRRADLDLLRDLRADGAESAVELALRHAEALDRERLTRRVYRAIRRARDELAAAWTGVPEAARADRLELALLTLNRLLFLTFLQQKGWLDGDPHYLRSLVERPRENDASCYRGRLVPLFFGALNTRPYRRAPEARALGRLPYLNGGLFQPHAVETRYPRLDAPDDPVRRIVLDVLERHRFTAQEESPLDRDASVDPEMLGRAFEGLMRPRTRAATGTFYTPARWVRRLVDVGLAAYLERAADLDANAAARLVRDPARVTLDDGARRRAADALRRVRVLDPAAGSGAFLLAALDRLERLARALDPEAAADGSALRTRIVHENLYGVDRNGAAVRLCELRLWLALVVDLEVEDADSVPPLPNLDHKIRQGDTLLDPTDAAASVAGPLPALAASCWRRELRELQVAKARYLNARGAAKAGRARALSACERRIARRLWDAIARRLDERIRDLRAAARTRDLFGETGALAPRQRAALREALRARRELRRWMRLAESDGDLPFFSWAVHFAEVHAAGGFDLVVGNPPWVRPHRVAPRVRETLRARYGVVRRARWAAGVAMSGAGAGFGSQVDLAAPFVERGLELLRPGGVLAFLVPAKLAHALYGGGWRALLLRETTLLRIEDHSRARRAFDATTYPLALVCRKERGGWGRPVVHVRAGDRGLRRDRISQARLPLWPDDPASPWCLAPVAAREVVARMVDAGPPLAHAGFAPARGIVTGANAVFCGCEGELEPGLVRPALRGQDVRAWRAEPRATLVFPHDPRTGRPLARLGPAAAAYFARHERLLRRRRDLRAGDPYWTLFRVSPAKLGACVAWRDLGRRLEAVALPGLPEGPVPLNTVYLVPTRGLDQAYALAALLNSALVSAFLATFAERAAGGFYRFLGWTVGCLPLPGDWTGTATTRAFAEIGAAAHAAGGLPHDLAAELESRVAHLYGLDGAAASALLEYHAFLAAGRDAAAAAWDSKPPESREENEPGEQNEVSQVR